MKKNKILILLLVIVLLGGFLRFYKIGANSFVADEFLDMNSSYAYRETGKWQAWDFNLGQVNDKNVFAPRDERAWMYKWQVAELFKFLPPTEGVARSVSAFWGILSILIIFIITSKFTKNKTIGLIVAFLFAISPDALEFDRKLRMYAMFFPVFLAFSWTLFQFLESEYRGKIKFVKKFYTRFDLNLMYLIPMALLGALSLHLHLLTANIGIVLVVYLVLMLALKIKNKEKLLNKYSVFLGAGILGLISAVLLFPSEIQVATKELGWGITHFSYIEKVLSDYSHPLFAIAFIFLGIFYLYKKIKLQKEALWIACSFFTVLLLAIFFWDRNVGAQYIFFAESFKIILVASGIYCAAIFFRDNLTKFSARSYLATLILSLLILPNYAYFWEINNTYHQTSTSDNPNYRSVFTYFKKKKNSGDTLVTRNFRNYYYSGLKARVVDFGGEITRDKIDLSKLQSIMNQNPSGWIILSENDNVFVSKEARDFMDKNLTKINDIAVRGKISVYRWQK